MRGCVGTMNKPNDINDYHPVFYEELEQRRSTVTQFLNSKGIKKGDRYYLSLIKQHHVAVWCKLLRYKLYEKYWKNQDF